MSKNIDTTISLLSQFGLSEQESLVYLEIIMSRGDTALTISRHLKIKRTTVYRLLDNLVALGVVIARLGDRGARFVAIPDHLDLLIENKEQNLAKLKSTLLPLKSQLEELSRQKSGSASVLYYHGIDGLKQVTYNSLKAQGELLTYELGTMNDFLDKSEAEKLRQRFVENKITSRTLTSATQLDAWTDVTEIVEKYWEIRHLDQGESPFQFEILIYNDVYCMYRYTGDEIFCVEIHSQELADQQKQLFKHLWAVAKPFKILDSHGTAVVTNKQDK